MPDHRIAEDRVVVVEWGVLGARNWVLHRERVLSGERVLPGQWVLPGEWVVVVVVETRVDGMLYYWVMTTPRWEGVQSRVLERGDRVVHGRYRVLERGDGVPRGRQQVLVDRRFGGHYTRNLRVVTAATII